MIEAVEAVRERACRAAAALEHARIPYAVSGGNAVAAWVARVDRAAVRNTQDVDILVRRSDFDAVKIALVSVGFAHRNVSRAECFIDGLNASPRDAVHLLFAGEEVRPTDPAPSADVTEAVRAEDYQILSLGALVRMKLTSFRRKDQVHLLDLLDIGLIDDSWVPRLLPAHAERLTQLIDDPEDKDSFPDVLSVCSRATRRLRVIVRCTADIPRADRLPPRTPARCSRGSARREGFWRAGGSRRAFSCRRDRRPRP